MAKEELTVTQLAEKNISRIRRYRECCLCHSLYDSSTDDGSRSQQGQQARVAKHSRSLRVVDDEQLQVIIGPGKVNKSSKCHGGTSGC